MANIIPTNFNLLLVFFLLSFVRIFSSNILHYNIFLIHFYLFYFFAQNQFIHLASIPYHRLNQYHLTYWPWRLTIMLKTVARQVFTAFHINLKFLCIASNVISIVLPNPIFRVFLSFEVSIYLLFQEVFLLPYCFYSSKIRYYR